MRLGNMIVILLVLVLSLSSVVFADEVTDSNVKRDLDIFKAEMRKDMTTMKEEIIQANNDYNDENYQIFDGRISDMMRAMEKKAIIGLLGLNIFVASAAGLFYNWVSRRTLLKKKITKVETTQPPVQQFQGQSREQQFEQPQPVQGQGQGYQLYGYDQFFDQQHQEQQKQQEATPSFMQPGYEQPQQQYPSQPSEQYPEQYPEQFQEQYQEYPDNYQPDNYSDNYQSDNYQQNQF